MEPFASLAGAVGGSVPRLLINRDPVGPFAGRHRARDVVRLGDVVEGVRALVDALGWTRELDALMAAAALKVCVCVCVVVTALPRESSHEPLGLVKTKHRAAELMRSLVVFCAFIRRLQQRRRSDDFQQPNRRFDLIQSA